MSKYTTEVRYICESLASETESQGYDSIDDIVGTAAPLVFDFSFPIFDETYRLVFEKMILKHYYTREIGEETVGLWKLRLETRLNEKMPYFNKLYSSQLIDFNPLYDVDITREHKGKDGSVTTNDSQSKGLSSNTDTRSTQAKRYNLFSDTPEGSLTGVDNETYLTNATKSTDNQQDNGFAESNSQNTFNSNVIANNMDEYIEHVTGKQGSGSFSSMIKEFRETFINVDEMVLDSLSDLFINLW